VSADAAARLRQLADNAGENSPHIGSVSARLELEEMAPELARLAADMADQLREIQYGYTLTPGRYAEVRALLARVDTLTKENEA
jgi:hypothetical protein